jgi:MoaA/NifB/PqqE/SkfB family radical SAM enzyme
MKHPPENIAFELSNRCNMAAIHPECPTDSKTNPVFLNTSIIMDAVLYMGTLNWKGNFYFNIYNEPLIDPRLYWLFKKVMSKTEANIQIFTNGWYLNEYLYKEISSIGPGRIGWIVSVYSDSEEERLRKIEGLNVQRITLDERKRIYSCPPIAKGPCLAPSIYPMINHRGELVYCCMDYEYRNVIADLNEIPFSRVIGSYHRMKICDDLSNGIRNTDTCKRCPHIGWGISLKEWIKSQ